ncbi:MAG: hypothetical protein NTY15_08040 [Planctomycetota bacterium]|nr:hypothetical protein [Planctomycetota bacterium]
MRLNRERDGSFHAPLIRLADNATMPSRCDSRPSGTLQTTDSIRGYPMPLLRSSNTTANPHSSCPPDSPRGQRNNAVALRLSTIWCVANHGFHPWLSNATAPQLRQLR